MLMGSERAKYQFTNYWNLYRQISFAFRKLKSPFSLFFFLPGDMLDEMTAIVDGYNAFFSFSRKRSGYSGVVTYCKDYCLPVKAEEGLSGTLNKKEADDVVGCYGDHSEFSKDELDALDAEGRTVITQHEIRNPDGSCSQMAVINVYCPRYDSENEERHDFKLRFFALLQTRAEALIESGSHVIILGDLNTTHQNMDHCEPDSEGGSHSIPSRCWLNQMLCHKQQTDELSDKSNLHDKNTQPATVTGGYFVDTFRYLHPDQQEAYTNWCTLTGARQTNFGRRLDYILCNERLNSALISCCIMANVDGSDHCPVKASFDFSVVTALKAPSYCAKFMPEFAGKQQKLSMFFTKSYGKPSTDMSANNNIVQHSASTEGKDKRKHSPHSLKRQSSESLGSQKKKGKSCFENKPKQINLMGFFNKKPASCPGQLGRNSSSDSKKPSSDDSDVNDSSESQEITTAPSISSHLESSSKNVQDSSLLEADKEELIVSKVKSTTDQTSNSQVLAWKNLLKGPPPAPLCPGHSEPCVLRTVKKPGPTQGRQFYTCARPDGAANNQEARCNFFKWIKDLKK
ncbi:DNA-(apurinic or apyrimidinic site) endonuclease 2 isoform X1 [Octopus sinensis]|uniref:DNA-(apurinic or apyrimidinic site) endonuclease n=1 Tax=Octopus sinensis TaxID=2607531 RepID=A0A7E6EVH5_9MOLL|nr:DNA-(apurinic or apyrimidinic site) endonuclease 2 isoform X1 [Octopus sinensis]